MTVPLAPKGCCLPVPGTGAFRDLVNNLARQLGRKLTAKELDTLRQMARRQALALTNKQSGTKSTNKRVFKTRGEPYQYKSVYISRPSGTGKPVGPDGKRRSR